MLQQKNGDYKVLNRWMIYTCCLLPIGGWSEEAPQKNNDVLVIEQKVRALKNRLEQDRLSEMDEEVKAQDYFIADWEAYREELEKVRKLDDKERQILNKIQQLELEKARLLKQSK